MKKNYIALLVYNRLNNLKIWLNSWSRCNKHDFELVVIHNCDEDGFEYKELCDYYGIQYIRRDNVGYDTAPFQDICLERLDGFDNDWDKLMWVTDDFIPMNKDFIKQYVNYFVEGSSEVIVTEISNDVKTHIRTSGFLISKNVSKKIIWDSEKVTTKDECYDFEHRSQNAFYEQVLRLGFTPIMVAPLNTSPLWDSDHRAFLNRMKEHETIFSPKNKVAIICPIYKCFPQIISSMICQTYKEWELYLIYDGIGEDYIKDYVEFYKDDRIKYIQSETRVANYGHPLRSQYLNNLKNSDCDFVVITNGDNYHTPNYLENLINGFDDNTIATYCESMVHNYFGWGVIQVDLRCGFIDCACVMVKKDYACKVGWNDVVSHTADWKYFDDIGNAYGWDRWKKVNGCLLIHN